MAFETLKRLGRDLGFGLKLPLLFAQSGVGMPDGTDVVGRFQTPERMNYGVRELFRSLAPRAIAIGLVSKQESQRLLKELDEPPAGAFSALSPLMIGAWRRKTVEPAARS